MRVLVINGANLNMTGTREKSVYGGECLDEINAYIWQECNEMGIEVDFFQSNCEGEIINKIHECHGNVDGLVINPGAYTHYSYAIHDAIASVDVKTVEVHMSNVHARQEWRHKSVTAPACVGQICGLGKQGYLYAIKYLAGKI